MITPSSEHATRIADLVNTTNLNPLGEALRNLNTLMDILNDGTEPYVDDSINDIRNVIGSIQMSQGVLARVELLWNGYASARQQEVGWW